MSLSLKFTVVVGGILWLLLHSVDPAQAQAIRGTLDDDTMQAQAASGGNSADQTGSLSQRGQLRVPRQRTPEQQAADQADRAYREQNPLTASMEERPEPREFDPALSAPPVPPEQDPYAAPGIRIGSWLVRPSVETSLGYNDNINALNNNRRGSAVWRIRPEIGFESDWSQHALSGTISLDHEEYRRQGLSNNDTVDLDLNARVDITRDLTFEGSFKYNHSQQSLSDPNVSAASAEEPNIDLFNGEGSLTKRFGRYFAAVFGSIERALHENVAAVGGGRINNKDRNYTALEGGLRLGYDISDRTSVFAEVAAGETKYDQRRDDGGTLRGSKTTRVSVGASHQRDNWTSESRIGFRITDLDDPSFSDIRGLVAENSLTWQATPLTSLTLRTSTGLDETVLANTSSVRTYSAELSASHDFRRNLLGTASLAWDRSEYIGTRRNIDVVTARAGLEYKMNRYMALRANYEYVRSSSKIQSESYRANTVSIGVILRR